MSDFERASFFDLIDFHDKKQVAKVFFAEVIQHVNASGKSISVLGISPHEIAITLLRLEEGVISGKHVKEIIPLIIETKKTADQIIEDKGFKQISDENILTSIISKIINENKTFIEENKERPERIAKNLLGLLMKETGGQANPVLSNKILEKLLEK